MTILRGDIGFDMTTKRSHHCRVILVPAGPHYNHPLSLQSVLVHVHILKRIQLDLYQKENNLTLLYCLKQDKQ
jgi:hypothetical protein